MNWPPQQQNVAPPLVVQQVQPSQGYSYDPSQVPMQPQQQVQPYYAGQPTPVFQQQAPQQPQQMQQAQQPQYGYQPQQYQQQPQQLQQPQQRPQFDENVVLDGPGVAPELRGRTMGDAMRLYRALSTDWLSRQRQPTTPAQQTLQAQGLGQQPGQLPPGQQAPMQYQQQPQQQQIPPQQAQFQQQLQQAVQQVVQPLLQPVVQQSQTQAIMAARQQAQQLISDYTYLEADIIQSLNGATPEQLSNPQIWQMAANAARGARVLAGQYRPQPQQPRLPGNGGPGGAVPAQQIPPAYQFFTESPSAPNVGAGVYGANARQVTSEDQFYARQFNMPIENYMAWKHGQQQQPIGAF